MAVAEPRAPERTIGELFGELARETSTLVRQEVKLATTELTDKASRAGRQTLVILGGALLGFVSVLLIAATIVLALALAMPLWGAALLVAIVFGIAGYLVVRAGYMAIKHMDLHLRETAASLKEDKLWLTQQIQ